ncbi:MAG: alpha/beta fold hydrolase [Deltaproteobacteria bacterium]|nr:alpha/beta fold hydrolase [Deltaproteobacteria bacterium]
MCGARLRGERDMARGQGVTMEKVTPDELLNVIGVTAADNREHVNTALAWKSKMAGAQVRGLFGYQRILDSVAKDITLFGPWAIAAAWQSAMLDTVLRPVRAGARIAVGAGRNPDAIADVNGWIYKNYSRLLYTLTGFFMKDGRFNREKALSICTTDQGKDYLKNYMDEFAQLERAYNNIGLTRLKAMKELLKCLLVVITEQPFTGGCLPFAKTHPDGSPADSFEEYLAENRRRLENLFSENAFDIKEYSERKTSGNIGCSAYEFVDGSTLHRVRLRHYPVLKGVKRNGKVLYMVTPLINRPELFDLAPGKSVVEAMQKEGYDIYLVDHGDPGWEETGLTLDFYGKTIHDAYIEMIRRRHPRKEIYVMGYCMGGTLIMPYLARRAEELLAAGKPMDIRKVALMASPVKFDDGESGHAPIRSLIRRDYDPDLMKELFGAVNIPPQIIEAGMNEIQPGVQYTVVLGFYGRAESKEAIRDAAPFLYWLTHGTKFPIAAHIQWIQDIFIGNQIYEGKYCLPSANPEFDGQPVNMNILMKAGVSIFDYKGSRDPIAPAGSCVAAETWGQVDKGNVRFTGGQLNRTIEKNIGHIFVVSRKHLAEYLQLVKAFYKD